MITSTTESGAIWHISKSSALYAADLGSIFEFCVQSVQWMLQHLNVIRFDDFAIHDKQCINQA